MAEAAGGHGFVPVIDGLVPRALRSGDAALALPAGAPIEDNARRTRRRLDLR
jgi:hypothetical protein